MIGDGRADDPRQWVQAAYLVLDAIEERRRTAGPRPGAPQ
jgi:hypothetical protein